MTHPHQIVAHTITPVEVLAGENGEPVIVENPEEEAVTVYGCELCDLSLGQSLTEECVDIPR